MEGKLTLVLEGLEGTGLLGLLSGGEGSGRAEDSSEAGSSLHLGKQFDTAELGRNRKEGSGRKNRASVTAIFASTAKSFFLCQKRSLD